MNNERQVEDEFARFMNERIDSYIQAQKECTRLENMCNDETPESVKTMYNSQGKKMFEITVELQQVLEKYNRQKACSLKK